MSKASRLISQRPFLFASSSSSSSTQSLSLSRRSALNDPAFLAHPTRQRLLYTTRMLRATIVTSATSSSDPAQLSSSSGVDVRVGAGVSVGPSSSRLGVEARRSEDGKTKMKMMAQVLRMPTSEDIEKAELDVDVLPHEECKVLLTERAAEQLRRISTREGDPDVALRISVESGGCHGYQYKMSLTSTKEQQPDDYVFAHPTLRPSNILVDAISLPLLNGSTLDFVTELIGSSFRVSDNPQAKNSGCGCGVSWELKI